MNILYHDKITPTFHYIIHYPSIIRKLGPLRSLWCMRFEAKHQYFKRISQRIFNFKNIAKSLANRHQMRLCWDFIHMIY